MFSSENELVEKLVIDLQTRYDTKYIVRELRSGNNIADIVYTKSIIRNNVVFDEYLKAYYYFTVLYNRRKINISELKIENKEAKRKFCHFLNELETLGYIKISGNYITTIRRVDEVSKDIIAIEAKLSDWKSGVDQALRYRQYANEVYVALSAEHISKVNTDTFRELGIGLMSVSATGPLKIPILSKKSIVENKDIQYFIADRFLRQLNLAG